MKKIHFLIALLFNILAVSAQDKVKFLNGNVGEGRVVEVTSQFVKFVYRSEVFILLGESKDCI